MQTAQNMNRKINGDDVNHLCMAYLSSPALFHTKIHVKLLKKNWDNTQSFNNSYVIYISYFTMFVVRLRGVVVRALASHAMNREFDPR